ncbi:MAG: caspase family protein [Proteobacteria bacterium]|nr:caspase family protein [Pseudomonadota bacterium]MBU1711247.1 caspase family protein [Pseudomonadota bacterium]
MKLSAHIFLILALVVLSGCKKEVRDTSHDPVPPPKPVSALEQNLLELYEAETVADSGQPSYTQSKKTVVNDTDTIPDFAKAFDDDDLAVVIGIEFYQTLPPVEFSANDADLVRQYLAKMGFAERNIRYLANEKATDSAIRVSIEKWLANNVKPTSRVFFFYSGHGSPEPTTGNAYLVPYDGDPNYLADTSYSLTKLYDNLGRLPASEVIVVIDACFSGIGGRSVLAKGVRAITIRKKEPKVSANMVILAAAQDKEIATSYPEKQHGLFTYHFLKALKDGKKTIPEVYEYLKPLVEDEARRQNKSQTPRLSPTPEETAGRFTLVR